MVRNLIISKQLFDRIVRHAKRSAPDECMGLLARRSQGHPGLVTAACLLPAVATPSKAEASPIDIRSAVVGLMGRGLVPFGLWHSHGGGGVHHSTVDDETTLRLLPAMAEMNFERPCTMPLVPCVTAPDEADLPLPDGTTLHFTLLGRALPGLDARERIAWSSISARFRDEKARPRAVHGNGRLHLIGGPVVLSLGLPYGSTLESRVVDRAPVRSARLFSLVVNTDGEAYTEVLVMHDIEGRPIIGKQTCALEIVETKAGEKAPPQGVRVDQNGACVRHASDNPAGPQIDSYFLEGQDDHDKV